MFGARPSSDFLKTVTHRWRKRPRRRGFLAIYRARGKRRLAIGSPEEGKGRSKTVRLGGASGPATKRWRVYSAGFASLPPRRTRLRHLAVPPHAASRWARAPGPRTHRLLVAGGFLGRARRLDRTIDAMRMRSAMAPQEPTGCSLTNWICVCAPAPLRIPLTRC